MVPLRFVPYHELGEIPNVIVDGGPTPSTRLTLSHWPGSPTPFELLDDLSAQIALRALDRPELFDGIEAVSNNHFDQDGLASAFALLFPDEARRRADQIVDVARAGDFGTCHDRDSLRLAWAIAAHEDPARSPLDAAVLAGGYEQTCGRLYEEMLPRFTDLLDDVEATRPMWQAEDAHVDECLAAIADGVVAIDEVPALDLAVVTIPDDWTDRVTSRFTVARNDALHPAALNLSTDRLRLLLVHGRQYRLEMRYESWVMYRSRPVLHRPDLRLLAAQLDEVDSGVATWTANAPGALTPVLRVSSGETSLSPEGFRATVERFLAEAPPAWDPFASR